MGTHNKLGEALSSTAELVEKRERAASGLNRGERYAEGKGGGPRGEKEIGGGGTGRCVNAWDWTGIAAPSETCRGGEGV